MKWIRPEDEMPPTSKRVLIAYINSSGKNRVVVGHYTKKFTDENYDSDGEFYEIDEKTETCYVPEGWYEDSFNHEEFSGYWLENQDVLFWGEMPEFPRLKK